jgi:cytidylate kinase
MQPFVIIAIDGGAASGKSTTARRLSERFHLLHVDTGSFYRAFTAEFLRRGVAASDAEGIRAALKGIRLGTRIEGRSARIEIDGRIPSEDEIRGRAVNDAVSHFAAIPEVRNALLAYQRGQADVALKNGFRGLVMEGRDIGSVIFPNADFRYFLHADPVERARRRAEEGRQDAIVERDRLDTVRTVSPLACPPGATAIDTTHTGVDAVVDLMTAPILQRLEPKS